MKVALLPPTPSHGPRRQARHPSFAEQVPSRPSSAFLAAIVDSSEDAIISKSIDGLITTWNRAAERMFQYPADEAIGRPITMLIPPDRMAEEMMILGKLKSGQRIEHYETVRRARDGSKIEVSLSISPIRSRDGQIVGAAKIIRDITERKRLEELTSRQRAELEHLSRLNTAGKLTVGLAHELNQPLSAITNFACGSLAMIKSGTASPNSLTPALTNIINATDRAVGIITSLRKLVRKKETVRKLQDVNPIIIDIMRLMNPALRDSQISALTDMGGGLPLVLVDSVQVGQVLVNLVQNAMDAMKSPGTHGRNLTVTSRLDGAHVCVDVCDQGCGIPACHIESVFESFVSTKPEGLGMGLAISRSIMEDSGGTLVAKPNPIGGMIFTCRFPILDEGSNGCE